MQIVPFQRSLVRLYQAHLTHSGRRLQLVDTVRTFGKAKPAAAFGDGTRGNQGHLTAQPAKFSDLRTPARDARVIDSAAVSRQQRATDFDDPTPGEFDAHPLLLLLRRTHGSLLT
jgi:hypothetical protein